MLNRRYWRAAVGVLILVSFARLLMTGSGVRFDLVGVLWFGISIVYGLTMRSEVGTTTPTGWTLTALIAVLVSVVLYRISVAQLPQVFLAAVGLLIGMVVGDTLRHRGERTGGHV